MVVPLLGADLRVAPCVDTGIWCRCVRAPRLLAFFPSLPLGQARSTRRTRTGACRPLGQAHRRVARMVKAGSLKDGWAGTCLLPEELKAQVKLRYDVAEYPFARLAKAALGSVSKPSPQLARGLVQARKGSEETVLTRRQAKAWKQSAEWVDFLALYRRFVREWVQPQFGCDLLSCRAIPCSAPDPYPNRYPNPRPRPHSPHSRSSGATCSCRASPCCASCSTTRSRRASRTATPTTTTTRPSSTSGCLSG
jgi:hypothetical protein